MFQRTKQRLCPLFWGQQIGVGPEYEVMLRNESSVLRDRYSRGMRVWETMIETHWLQFGQRFFLKSQLTALQAEYSDLLRTLVDAEQRRRVHVVNVPYPSKATFVKSDDVGRTLIYMPGIDDPTGTTTHIPLDIPELDNRKHAVFSDGSSPQNVFHIGPSAAPAAPTSTDFSGSGGKFGGAGASGDWGSGGSDSSSDFSSDSGGGSGGSGGFFD